MPAGRPAVAKAYLSECADKLQESLKNGSYLAWSARKDRGAKRDFLRKSILPFLLDLAGGAESEIDLFLGDVARDRGFSYAPVSKASAEKRTLPSAEDIQEGAQTGYFF